MGSSVAQAWIKDLNIRHEIIKLLEENIYVGLGNNFFGVYTKAKARKQN